MSALTAGQYIDSRFRLIHPVGVSGSRDVWLADDVDLGEQVALAVLPSDTAIDRITLLRRTPAMPAFDFHRGSAFSYITLPYADGGDVEARANAIIHRLREQSGGPEGRQADAGMLSDNLPVRLTPPPRVQPIRPITPRLARPTQQTGEPSARRHGMLRAIPAVIALVIVAVAILLFFLARIDPQPEGTAGDPVVAGDTPAAPQAGSTPLAVEAESQPGGGAPVDDLRRRAYLKDQAEDAARRARDLSESLQARGVTLWGDDRYALARQQIADGDARLAEDLFDMAEGHYLEAIRTLQAVDTGSLDVLKDLLDDGRSALAAGDATTAAAAFSLAARIDPSSHTAATGLRRAGVFDELNRLLDDGAQLERGGDMTAAERIYSRAVTLDPQSQVAREALSRVKARIGDDAFAAEISTGLEALARSDFQGARQAFRRAGELRPESRQVAEGLIQTEEGEKLAAITMHRDRAAGMEQAERWRAAEREYDSILRLDPLIRVAAEGVERTRARADLSEALAYHLAHPDRLAADEVFEEASRLYDRAAAIAPAGPQLRGQVEALDALLGRMRDAVPVVLESDGRTEVTIYRVGRLGSFSRHEVELRPGTYTVVGTRRGYRDVRHQLVIVPGKTPDILVVRCEEKI